MAWQSRRPEHGRNGWIRLPLLTILSDLGGKGTNQCLIGSIVHFDFLFRQAYGKVGHERFQFALRDSSGSVNLLLGSGDDVLGILLGGSLDALLFDAEIGLGGSANCGNLGVKPGQTAFNLTEPCVGFGAGLASLFNSLLNFSVAGSKSIGSALRTIQTPAPNENGKVDDEESPSTPSLSGARFWRRQLYTGRVLELRVLFLFFRVLRRMTLPSLQGSLTQIALRLSVELIVPGLATVTVADGWD